MKALSLFLAMITCAAVTSAQEPAAATATSTPMAAAIEKTTFVTSTKPSTEAKYYMFLASASWCGPCRAVTPKLVQEYPNMMADKDVEVILLSCDRTPETAKKYLDHYKAPFAGVMYGSPEALKLPGCPTDIHGIPHIVVVDANGKMLYRGHGSRFADWKKEIENAKNAQ